MVWMVLNHHQQTISILSCSPNYGWCWTYQGIIVCDVLGYWQPKHKDPNCQIYYGIIPNVLQYRDGVDYPESSRSSPLPSFSVCQFLDKSWPSREGCGWCPWILIDHRAQTSSITSTLDLQQAYYNIRWCGWSWFTLSSPFPLPFSVWLMLADTGPTQEKEGSGWYLLIVVAHGAQISVAISMLGPYQEIYIM